MKGKYWKRIIYLYFAFAVFFNLENFALAKNIEETVQMEQESLSSRGVSRTGYVLLAAGESFSIKFNMNNFASDDHNAFNVKIHDFDTGSVKVKITGSNGYSWESDFINTTKTFITSNAKPDVTYTVTIQASTAGSCYAQYSITSYIK